MVKNYVIKEPFFEYGPKCYMYGDTLLEIEFESAGVKMMMAKTASQYIAKI